MSFPKNEQTDALTRAILSLRNEEECYDFFEDVCTIKEVLSMAQRLRVAELLSEGNSYQSVCEKTGASSATDGRILGWMRPCRSSQMSRSMLGREYPLPFLRGVKRRSW